MRASAGINMEYTLVSSTLSVMTDLAASGGTKKGHLGAERSGEHPLRRERSAILVVRVCAPLKMICLDNV